MRIRVSAVEYLNARPLVEGLDRHPDQFVVRFDVPATCAALLHDKEVDLGLIPSIEYLRRPDYWGVPGVAVVSHGPVASVAVFTTRPIASVRSMAIDSTSRTSVALLRVLCAKWFEIDPKLVTMAPDPAEMTRQCDAALLIGDVALFTDHRRLGLEKIDLGEEWKSMTGLPFVYAFWVGYPNVVTPAHVAALQAARDEGAANPDRVARKHCGPDPDKVEIAAEYLRRNVRHQFGEAEIAGLRRFYGAAAELGIVPPNPQIRFY